MTAPTAPAPGAGIRPGRSGHPLAQAAVLWRRSILAVLRQPQVLFPSLFFPLFFTALNSAAFDRTTRIPGFPPVDSFLDFLLPATILQGVIFGSTQAGTEMATDIQDGFFDRLLVSPVSRTSILVGRLAGAAALGATQAVFFMAVLAPFGARVAGGPVAIVVVVIVAALMAVGIGGFGLALGIRSGSPEAVQGAFPLIFVLLFTSSAFFPRELMSGWYRDLAGINPISWIIEGLRHLTTIGFDASEAATAAGVSAGLCVLTVALSHAALRRRLRVAA